MRIFAVMVILLLAVGGGVAAEQETPKQTGGTSGSGEVNPVAKPEVKTTKEKKALKWPRPHQPSEEISADSIVPFPVDI